MRHDLLLMDQQKRSMQILEIHLGPRGQGILNLRCPSTYQKGPMQVCSWPCGFLPLWGEVSWRRARVKLNCEAQGRGHSHSKR